MPQSRLLPLSSYQFLLNIQSYNKQIYFLSGNNQNIAKNGGRIPATVLYNVRRILRKEYPLNRSVNRSQGSALSPHSLGRKDDVHPCGLRADLCGHHGGRSCGRHEVPCGHCRGGRHDAHLPCGHHEDLSGGAPALHILLAYPGEPSLRVSSCRSSHRFRGVSHPPRRQP